MNKLLRAARTRAGIVVSTVGLVMVGGGVAAAAVIGSPEPSQGSTTTQPVETTAPAPVEAVRPAQVPVAPPVVEAPAATVEDVTEPQAPAPAPTRAPAAAAPHDASTTWVEPESGATYLPAPEVPPAKLESEVGYDNSGD